MRRAERRDHRRRQAGEFEVAAEPAFRHVQPLRHALLAAAVVAFDGAGIVAGALVVREVLAAAVLQVGKAERLLIGQLARLDQEAELGMQVGAQPRHRPMPPRAADHLEVMRRVALDAADDGGHLLAALGLEAVDQVGADGLVQRRVVAVVPRPDAAARRVHPFLHARDHAPRGQLRQPVLPRAQDAGARRQPPGRRLGPCRAAIGNLLGKPLVPLRHHGFPLSANALTVSCTGATGYSSAAPRSRSAWLGQVRRICVSTSAFTALR
jgi:hypothetical protein